MEVTHVFCTGTSSVWMCQFLHCYINRVSFPLFGYFDRNKSDREKSYHDLIGNTVIVGLPSWFRWWSICLQSERPRFGHWISKIPWRREWLPTPIFLPGETHGQRNLEGYRPQGRKESHTTERLTLSLSVFTFLLLWVGLYIFSNI